MTVLEPTQPKVTSEVAEKAPPDRPEIQAPPGGSFIASPVVMPIFTRERFSEEQQEIDTMVREFARERLLPEREALSKLDKELSLELLREVGELGLTGIDIPESYGGLELDKTTSALVVEALTTGGSASWTVTFSVHVGIGTLPIVYFGTEEQKKKYLPKMGTGEWIGAYALTEPEAGSDAGNQKTTAKLTDDGEHYILNGTKQYITNGSWADVYIVFANLEGYGPTAFIVDRSTEGLSIGAEEHKLGIKGSSTTPVLLDSARVPVGNLLGRPGKGMPIALNILNVGRFKLGAADLGGAKIALKFAVDYALERQQFGQPVAYFEAVRKKFSDMVVRTFLLDSVIYRTVGLMDTKIASLDTKDERYPQKVMDALEEYAIEASISKIFGSETMFKVADHGVQIYGGNGFSEEYPMAELYRDCRIDRIFEGTNEINRMVIYGYLLKKTLMEEIPLRDALRDAGRPAPADSPFAWEIGALETVRALTLELLHEAISLYGQDLRNAQVVGEDLADLVIGYFAGSSALNRILQLDARSREDRVIRALGRLAIATCLEDVWRIVYRLRPVLYADAYGKRRLDKLDSMLAELHLPFDPVRDLHVLTDDLYDHRAYRFE